MTDMSRLHFKLNLPSIRWNGQPEEDNVVTSVFYMSDIKA